MRSTYTRRRRRFAWKDARIKLKAVRGIHGRTRTVGKKRRFAAKGKLYAAIRSSLKSAEYWTRSVGRMTPDGDAARFSLAGLAPILGIIAGAFLFPEAASRVSAFAAFVVLIIATTSMLVALTWFAMGRSTAEDLREWARFQHEPRPALERFRLLMYGRRIFGGRTGFATLISYSVIGLGGTLLLIPAARGEFVGMAELSVYALSVFGVLVTWSLLHTAFALHYVYLYHDPENPGGLEFPGGDGEPAAADFAYFAFTLATSFAASDVPVTASRMRKSVMAHCVLAFFFNTAVFALVVNIVISNL